MVKMNLNQRKQPLEATSVVVGDGSSMVKSVRS